MFKFIFCLFAFILVFNQYSLADVEIPLIVLIEEDGSVKTNCSNLDCPELALLLDYKLQAQNLKKSNQNLNLPYETHIPLSEKQIYELLLP